MAEPLYTGVDNLEPMAEGKNYNRFLVKVILRSSGGATAAVDFGAGTGTFASALKEQGFRVICIEPDEHLCRILGGLDFECHPSLDLLGECSADFIYSLNVLEHIQDDEAATRALYRCLKPGGSLYLYVPAFNCLFTSMDRKVGHFRRYRMATLVPLLKKAGFAVRSARYVDSLGFPITLLYRLVGSRKGDLNVTVLRFYDRVLFPLSRLLDRVLGRILGKNLAVTAIRPQRLPRPHFASPRRDLQRNGGPRLGSDRRVA